MSCLLTQQIKLDALVARPDNCQRENPVNSPPPEGKDRGNDALVARPDNCQRENPVNSPPPEGKDRGN